MSDRAHRGSPKVTLAAALVLLLVVGALWAFVFVDYRQGSREAAQAGSSTSSGALSSAPSRSSGSASSSADTDGWTMSEARTALAADDSRVLVLGDSTGDDEDEWIHVWAQEQEMPIASWSTASEDGYDSETSETRVWSGSAPDAAAGYPLKHEGIWPAKDPHLVILSFGHAYDSPRRATRGLETLRKDVADRAPKAPIVVILQNPQADDANAETREAIDGWAKGAGLPTIDIAAAFADSDLLPEDLRLDEFRPSLAGTELWVKTVEDALAS